MNLRYTIAELRSAVEQIDKAILSLKRLDSAHERRRAGLGKLLSRGRAKDPESRDRRVRAQVPEKPPAPALSEQRFGPALEGCRACHPREGR